MPKVANYFVRPEGVALSLATVKDVQYGECIDKLKQAGVRGCCHLPCTVFAVANLYLSTTLDYHFPCKTPWPVQLEGYVTLK